MTVPGNLSSPLLAVAAAAAAGGGITKSVRLNSGDSAYLNRTPSSAGNRKKYTWSTWVKRSSTASWILTVGTSADTESIYFNGGHLVMARYVGSFQYYVETEASFLDFSSWYHILIAHDHSLSTSTDRIKLYINGSRITEFKSGATFPPQNSEYETNSTENHKIGRYANAYLADLYFINDEQLDPTSFGAFDDSGVWQAAAYSGTFGTNGFHLFDFANESTLGHDSSGNENDFTAHNLVADGSKGSWYFNGSAGITGTMTALGNQNWTVEMFIEKTSSTGQEALFSFSSDNPTFETDQPSKVRWMSSSVYGSTLAQNTRYHIAWVRNSNKGYIYVDGTLISPSSGINYSDNDTNTSFSIGERTGGTTGFTGYIDNVRVVVGTAVYTSNFTVPSTPLTAVSNTKLLTLTSASLSDTSGQNVSLTNGGAVEEFASSQDVLRDVPVNGDASNDTGAGGELSSNYPTMNPLAKNSNTTLSNGNLDVSSTAVYTTLSTIAFPSTGKFYAEFKINGTSSGYPFVGIGGFNDTAIFSNANPNTGAFYAQGGYVTGSVSVSSLTALSAGDIVGVAYDTSNGKVWFSINGTYVSSGDPANGSNPTTTLSANASGYCLATSTYQSGTVTLNAGQRAFNTNAPSGFKCLCTSNLPTPTIADGSDYFDTALWTGNGSSQTISGLEFSPDFVWMKNMSFATDHEVYDTIRGVQNVIKTNLTDAEGADSSGLLSFTSDGWTLGSSGALNRNNDSIVGWAWDGGTSNASNSDGTITSTVRANIAAGFSIVKWTGTSSAATIGHGLGASLGMYIIKNTDDTTNWAVYHKSVGATKKLLLNTTAAASTSSFFNSTEPTSSVFSVGGSGTVNNSGDVSIAYCFTPVAGYSAFGSYEGNGATDGSFVYTGFRPRWIMLKNSDDTYHWYVYDTARVVDNDVRTVLVPSSTSTNPTDAAYSLDILSNGFKLRNSNIRSNASGDSYIYAAFAENPFQANGGLAR